MKASILVGDVLARLAELPDCSVQCVVTSPPYWGLRDYSLVPSEWPSVTFGIMPGFASITIPAMTCCLGLEKSPNEFIGHMILIFRDIRRLLADDGICFINFGDSYCAQPGQRKQGIERNDVAGWKQQTNTGCLTIGSRTADGLKAKDLVGIPWMFAFALRAEGWYLRQDIIWSKPNPMPESVTDRCTKAHEYLFLLTKSARYFYDAEAIKEPCTADHLAGNHTHKGLTAYEEGDEKHRTKQGLVAFAERTRLGREGANSRMHQDRDPAHPSARKVRSPAGWKTGNGSHGSIHEDGREQEVAYTETDATKRNKRSVWTIATQPYAEAHFATYPEALVDPCVLAGSKEGDTVLDPFCGSGTTGLVALRYHRNFVGIELNESYAGLAEKRMSKEAPMFNEVEVIGPAAPVVQNLPRAAAPDSPEPAS